MNELQTNDVPNIYKALDEEDEKQIEAELSGLMVKSLVYEVPIKVKDPDTGKYKVAGNKHVLTYEGVLELARYIVSTHNVKLITEKPEVTETDDKYYATVKAIFYPNPWDDSIRLEVYGAAQQKKKMKVNQRTGRYVEEEDDFAYQKAISKATRNAIRKCVPAKYTEIAIDQWLKEYNEKNKKNIVKKVDIDKDEIPQKQVSDPLDTSNGVDTENIINELQPEGVKPTYIIEFAIEGEGEVEEIGLSKKYFNLLSVGTKQFCNAKGIKIIGDEVDGFYKSISIIGGKLGDVDRDYIKKRVENAIHSDLKERGEDLTNKQIVVQVIDYE